MADGSSTIPALAPDKPASAKWSPEAVAEAKSNFETRL
jgi:hypothetical protein